jgi:periplasmic protein CpxP/Spy
MIMKKYMMVAGLMAVSTIIFAQRHKGDHGASPTKQADKMKTELSLSDDQYAKVKAINEKFAASHVKLRSDTALTVGTAHKQREKLKTDHQAQLKSVLTEVQWTKWSSLKSNKFEDRKKHGHRHGHGHDKGDKG